MALVVGGLASGMAASVRVHVRVRVLGVRVRHWIGARGNAGLGWAGPGILWVCVRAGHGVGAAHMLGCVGPRCMVCRGMRPGAPGRVCQGPASSSCFGRPVQLTPSGAAHGQSIAPQGVSGIHPRAGAQRPPAFGSVVATRGWPHPRRRASGVCCPAPCQARACSVVCARAGSVQWQRPIIPPPATGCAAPIVVPGAMAAIAPAIVINTPAEMAPDPPGATYTITGSGASSRSLTIVLVEVSRPPGVSN